MSENTQEELFEATSDATDATDAAENVAEVAEVVFIEGYGYVYADTGALVEADDEIPAEFAAAMKLLEASEIAEDQVPKVTEQTVTWALNKMFKLDGEILAAETRLKAEVDAITRNWKPRVNRLKGAKSYFLAWVTPQLREYAAEYLRERNTKPDGTTRANPEKSVKFPQGTLAFRAVNQTSITRPGSAGAAENKRALEWIKEHYPYATKVVLEMDLDALTHEDRATIEAVTNGSMTLEEAGWQSPCPLKVTLPGEKFDIRTGVK